MLDQILCLIPPCAPHLNVLEMGITSQQMKLRSLAQYFCPAVIQAELRESHQRWAAVCSPVTYIATYSGCYRIWR